jgi:hypothetical protein
MKLTARAQRFPVRAVGRQRGSIYRTPGDAIAILSGSPDGDTLNLLLTILCKSFYRIVG